MEIDSDFGPAGEENVRNLIDQRRDRAEGENVVMHQETVRASLEGEGEVIRCNPQPYVIVDCVDERLVSNFDYGNVLLQVTALGCFYTESLPTGHSNLAIPRNMFRR
jgi:hypothetical protein